jgi:hypothetical protein
MTPFDRASLSLSGAELPPPTVGGSPLISGGHVAPSLGDGFPVACASATFAAATLMNVAMIRMVGRKGNSSRTCGACYSTRGLAERVIQRVGALNVPEMSPRRARASGDFGVKKIVAVLWNVARVMLPRARMEPQPVVQQQQQIQPKKKDSSAHSIGSNCESRP